MKVNSKHLNRVSSVNLLCVEAQTMGPCLVIHWSIVWTVNVLKVLSLLWKAI